MSLKIVFDFKTSQLRFTPDNCREFEMAKAFQISRKITLLPFEHLLGICKHVLNLFSYIIHTLSILYLYLKYVDMQIKSTV
jgi:hypothetical protein